MLKTNPSSNAVNQTLFSSALLLASSLMFLFSPCRANYSHFQRCSGQTSMVVDQDKQKDLPPAQLGITPSGINETVSLKQNKNTARLNQSVTLYNYGAKPKKIHLNLVDMDASGKPVEPSETTLKPWTLINPTEFTIAPGGYQTVRMAIRLPLEFPAGKHGAMLSIEQQVDKSLNMMQMARVLR